MNTRLTHIRETLKKEGLDALLVTHCPNIRYVTDFNAHESWLLVTRRQAYYITDFRYLLEAQRGMKGFAIVQYKNSFFETIQRLLKEQQIKRLGFEENYISVSTFARLKRYCSRLCKLIPTANIIEAFREIKEAREINLIKSALRVHEESFRYLQRIIRPGLRELDILLKLEHFVKSRHCGFSFDPIIAAGPNSCFPHAKVTSRVIRPNDVLLIDWGIDFKGYKSDLTRMFFLGRIAKLVRTVNDTVCTAQQKAIAAIKAGVPIAEVDCQARNYLEEHKLAKYFGHALGHGVGLEIHESPRLSGQNKNRLQSGMVITVEPAVYLPGQFGIRIEDMVLVRTKRAEVLSGHIY